MVFQLRVDEADAPPALVPGDDGDRLLAYCLGDLLHGVGGLAAQEQRRVAAVDDGRGVILVGALELREGLQAECHGDVAAAHHGHHLLHVGEAPDVRELVHEHDHRARGSAPPYSLMARLQRMFMVCHIMMAKRNE